jgi:hypothetical protein
LPNPAKKMASGSKQRRHHTEVSAVRISKGRRHYDDPSQ